MLSPITTALVAIPFVALPLVWLFARHHLKAAALLAFGLDCMVLATVAMLGHGVAPFGFGVGRFVAAGFLGCNGIVMVSAAWYVKYMPGRSASLDIDQDVSQGRSA